jgi:hypothetical protein
VLYFVLADLAGVDVMYQFSLSWFRNMFTTQISQPDPKSPLAPPQAPPQALLSSHSSVRGGRVSEQLSSVSSNKMSSVSSNKMSSVAPSKQHIVVEDTEVTEEELAQHMHLIIDR